MKKLCVFVAAVLFLTSPALAQWQTPDHSIPIGRGGGVQGFRHVDPGTATYPLVSNGPGADVSYQKVQNSAITAGPASTAKGSMDGTTTTDIAFPFATGPTNTAKGTTDGVTTTNVTFSSIVQNGINTLCSATPATCRSIFGYTRPEWYGATPSPLFSSAGTVANNQGSIQAALNAARDAGGGVVKFGAFVYGVGNGVTSYDRVTMEGTGMQSTMLLLQPTTPTSAITFNNGGVLSYCTVRNLGIKTADTSLFKIGIAMIDVSQCVVEHVTITAYPSGQWTGTGSVGIQTQGRELTEIRDVLIAADLPIQISSNPHFAGGAEDLDSWVFRDLSLVGELSGATRNLIQVDANVSIVGNVSFQGRQNWAGGVDGFHWVGSAAAASFNLSFAQIKDEQPGAAGGYAIRVQPTNGLSSLSVSDSLFAGARNGILIQNVINTNLKSLTYVAGGQGLNADLTNTIISFQGNRWAAGTTGSLGAFTSSAVINPTGMSTAIPANGVLYK